MRSTIFSLLPGAAQAFCNTLPDVQVELLELLSEFQPAQLHSGRVDIGVARLLGEQDYLEDLQQTVLIEDPFVVVLPAHHRMARRTSIRLAELEGLPYISYPKSSESHFAQRMMAQFVNAGVQVRVVQCTAEIHTALGLVAAGQGVTLVGASVAANNRRDIRFVRVADCGFTSRLVALTRAGEESKLVGAFLSALKSAAVAALQPSNSRSLRLPK